MDYYHNIEGETCSKYKKYLSLRVFHIYNWLKFKSLKMFQDKIKQIDNFAGRLDPA